MTNRDSYHRKHIDKHNRPFHCSKCEQRFGRKYDLERHERSKHEQNAGGFFCTEPGCERMHVGFKRKDHLGQHLREVHKQKSEPESSSSPDQEVGDNNRRLENGNMAESSSSRKRRREREPELSNLNNDELIEEILKEREKRRGVEQELESQRERYEDRIDRLLRIFEGRAGK